MTDIGRARQDGAVPGGDPLHDPAAPGAREPRHETPHETPPETSHEPGHELHHEPREQVPGNAGHHRDLEGAAHGGRSGLVAHEARDDLTGRLRHAVAGFVDEPRAAVEEADHVLEDLTTRLAESLAGRRRTLRTSWQDSGEDTEQLRLALRDDRETAERLLSL
jgi:hypothetical protein